MALTWNDLPRPGSDDHKWSQLYNQYVQAGDVAGYLNYLQTQRPQDWAQWQASHPTTGTGGTDGTGGTGTGTGTVGGGPGAVPIGSPVPVMMGGLSENGRFGSYSSSPYQIGVSYAGPQTPVPGGAVPTPGGNSPPAAGNSPSAAGNSPTPATSPQPSGNTGNPAAGNSPSATSGGGMLGGGNGSGNYGGGMFGGGGNAAGGQGMLGGGRGFTGNNGASPAYDSLGSPVNIGQWGSNLLDAASYAPGWFGIGAGVLGAGLRGINTAYTDSQRGNLGVPGLDPGQWAGSLLGLNGYGALNGNRTIANPDQGPLGMAITTGGLYDKGLFGTGFNPLGLFSDYQGAVTPGEESTKMQYKTSLPSLMDTAKQVAARTPIMRADGTIIGYANPDGTSTSAAGANALGFSGGGAPGSPMGGQYGNNGVATGGMAGPVNRNSATGMLSRI